MHNMNLNSLKPAKGAHQNRRRVGRGIGCTVGKTCGRGHNGQKSRSGGYNKVGFEGGQMPLYRRIPKFGFNSKKNLYTEDIPLEALAKFADYDEITIDVLKQQKVVTPRAKKVRVYLKGEVEQPINVSGIHVTKGARAIIENVGGSVK